ncbi:hypothetical protein ACS0TY_007787 [Phlomoides rotata]
MDGGAENTPVIKAINKGVAHRICAGQVILDLSSAVKELVENSLDAGATCVEIALKEYGLEFFQVIDNGSGISPKNFKVLALKHHTSKLLDFPDLQSLTTFGFRGEALSSLCALGELTVETRTINEVVATHLTFDRMGLLTAERKTARQVGTTVTVKKLFSNLPVRSKEFHRNIRKEYGKLISLLNAYAVIAKGVRLVCTNMTGKNARSVVLKTQGSGCLKENIIMVFGTSTFSCLEPLRLDISDNCMVEGFISKPGSGSGRNIGDRQFFFVNGRPVDMPKVGKLVNELYRSANSRQYPIAIMNFFVPTRAYDVNVTPDKRKVFFSDENSILQSLREALENIYSSNEASYSVNRVDELKLASNVNSMHEKFEVPSDGVVEPKEINDKLCANGGSISTAAPDNIRDSPSEEMGQSNKGLTQRVYDNQMSKLSESPDKQIMIFFADKTDIHTSLQSRSTQKGSINNEYPRGRSNIVQMSLDKFVCVNKRKRESVETTLSEIPLLRSGPPVGKLREDSSLYRAASQSSRGNCVEIDYSNKSNEPLPAKNSSIDSVFSESDKSILLPCGDRKQSGARDDGDSSFLVACVDKQQFGAREKMTLKEQKAQVRVLDDESAVTASIRANSQQVPDELLDTPIPLQPSDPLMYSPRMAMKEQKGQVRVLDDDSAVTVSVRANSQLVLDKLSDAPIPLQTSDALMDSPVSSFLSSKLTVKEQKAHVQVLDDDSAVTASVRANSRQVSDAPNPLQSYALADSSGSGGGFTLQFSLKDLMSRRKLRLSRLQSIGHTSGRIKLKGGFAAASLELSQGVNEEGKAKALAAATSELERLFKKEDFKQIKVIGQFNLGFIIGKLDHDLFIVDQHAADEKYNYERLSQTTILNQQPLLRPLRMELAPEEEIVVSMHMDIFRKNGFSLVEDDQAPCGHRFILKAVPFSKNITFGVADIKELISILSDSYGECSMIGSYRLDTADSICPPKVRSMLASRACRSSVMIGDSLGRNEMHKILQNLAFLKSPWNCPHGRPTMRHLVDLRSVRRRRDEEEEEEEMEL